MCAGCPSPIPLEISGRAGCILTHAQTLGADGVEGALGGSGGGGGGGGGGMHGNESDDDDLLQQLVEEEEEARQQQPPRQQQQQQQEAQQQQQQPLQQQQQQALLPPAPAPAPAPALAPALLAGMEASAVQHQLLGQPGAGQLPPMLPAAAAIHEGPMLQRFDVAAAVAAVAAVGEFQPLSDEAMVGLMAMAAGGAGAVLMLQLGAPMLLCPGQPAGVPFVPVEEGLGGGRQKRTRTTG